MHIKNIRYTWLVSIVLNPSPQTVLLSQSEIFSQVHWSIDLRGAKVKGKYFPQLSVNVLSSQILKAYHQDSKAFQSEIRLVHLLRS